MERQFVVSYYLADDTVAVFETEVRNSGISGGTLPDGDRLNAALLVQEETL